MVDLKEFVRECVDAASGLAEFDEDGLVEILVPDSLKDRFPAGELVRLALDAGTAVRYPESVPALPGSQALDSLIEYAALQGRVTHAFPRTGPLRARPLAGEIAHAFTFTARRVRLPEGAATPEPATIAQFDFIVALVSDEREERLQSVVVDLWSGRADPALSRIVHALDVDATGDVARRRMVRSVDEAYGVAREALQSWTEPRIQAHQQVISRRLQSEHARLGLYYDAMIEDLEKRLQRAAADQEKNAALAGKIAATRLERESKLAELGEKYRLRPSARLAAVRLLTYPRLFATVGLDRRQVSRDVEVCWDPLTGRLQPLRCEGCGSDAARLDLGSDGTLRCLSCAPA